jgi:hypothetical protein
MTFTHALATNNYGAAKFIVATSAANGTHTTLASAMAAASSGDTIFLRDSVTENVTITPGVNITAWDGGTLNTPSITGTLTMTGAGTSNISGLRLVTNSAAAIAVTGSAASILNIDNCFLSFTNNTGISFTSSSASAQITLNYCNGNLGTTGIAIYSSSSAGSLSIGFTNFTNTGGSTTASTNSAGQVGFNYSGIFSPVSVSSAASLIFNGGFINTITQNATCITSTGTSQVASHVSASLGSGSASAISVGAGTVFNNYAIMEIFSSNTNAITGAGIFQYGSVVYNGSSSTNNVTTQTAFPHQAATNIAYTPVCGGTTNNGVLQQVASIGTSGQVLTSNGAGALPTFQTGGGGTFVKQTRANTSTAGSTATTIPFDDTIPQITEGAEVLTVAITPGNTNNILVIEYDLHMTGVNGNGTSRQFSSAIFQDSTANALYAQLDMQNGADGTANVGLNVKGRFYMTAGTTSSTTFRLRVGPAGAYTYYWLSNIGSAIFSTVNVATLTVSEYSA